MLAAGARRSALRGAIALSALLCACGPAAAPPPTLPATGITVRGALAEPASSRAIAVSPNGALVAAVNPDSATVSLLDALSLVVQAEVNVGDDPRTLAFTTDGAHLLVANHAGGTLSVVSVDARLEVARWPVGPAPYGVVASGTHAYVTLQAVDRVVAVELASGRISGQADTGPMPSGLALAHDGLLALTHLREGGVSLLATPALTLVGRVAPAIGAGVSQQVSFALPREGAGPRLWLPQTRTHETNPSLQFDTTLFPVVNVVDVAARAVLTRERVTLDTADRPVSMPFDAVQTPGGLLAVVNAGSNDLTVIDLATGRALAHLVLGANPRGIALAPDGQTAYVNNVLDGTVSVVRLGEQPALTATVRVTLVPLPERVLEGKRLFNAAIEPLLTTDNWISCAACHLDGTLDGRTWAGFPDGPRNTPSLQGAAGTLPLHWSGDLDELADVEHTIRVIQGGAGLIAGRVNDSLGSPNAGRSEALDALTAYLATLRHGPSPHQDDPSAIARGEEAFERLGCARCHAGPAYTDGALHDVGTGDAAAERNAHGRGTAFDTPTLAGLWASAPYLHDGSAMTLEEVLEAGKEHAVGTLLTPGERDDLLAFLRALPRP